MTNTSEEQQTKIIIDNDHTAQLISSKYNLKLIDKLLSYKEEGIEYSPRFQNSSWDGTQHLMTKAGRFAIGLIDKVKAHLEESEVEVILEDKRKKSTRNASIDLLPIFAKDGIVPRDYQLEAVEKAYNAPLGRGIVKAATGAGKTKIIALLLAKFNTKTVINVVGLDLLDQFYEEMNHLFPDETIGYIGNGKVIIGDRFTICSIWTSGSALNLSKKEMTTDDEIVSELPVSTQDKIKIINLLKEAELHIFDECHVCSCGTIQSIYKNINPKYIFGFSGTPHRAMNTGTDLITTGILGPIVFNITASSLIKRGVIAKPVIKFVHVPHLTNQGQTYQEVYKNYIVESDLRNNLIVSNAKNLLDKKYTVLVLFKTIKHGEILKEKFAEANIKVEFLSGKDNLEKRDLVKKRISSGESNIVISSTIFDVGLDLPILSAVILTGSGKGYVKALQRVGRVIRGYTSPDGVKKTSAAVVEFMDNCKYLKQHSLKRYEIYKTEEEFKIITCESMKKFI